MTTARQSSVHLEPPRSADVPHPAHLVLHRLRPAAGVIVRRRWDLTIRGAEHVPTEGPVVIAANHIGFVDGPLMAIVAPRPVHVLAKHEMYHGSLGTFLNASGQIPVERNGPDPAAVKTALRVLRDGGAVGVFPEGTRGTGEVDRVKPGAAYLAMAAGATVVPLVFLGTRLPGGSTNSVPPARSQFVMTFGEPLRVEHHRWPRRQPETHALSGRIREALLATLDEAQQATGMTLPGPIPATDKEIL
ncbi:lysophospholipid acyltransferase family protein [Nocardioides pocheonensis]|uniref:lysophospholipid acyltransferase family protein n=1 Tax=Nocardioides pocheonensis TaxID=661485 RepID=UPI001621A3D1|nr:lysophospholipid acyltransferase family protein [Nocardioides pocheonensis]